MIPTRVSKNWMLITRVIQPIVWQPYSAANAGGQLGFGDMNPTFFLSPANPGKLIWGPTMVIPSATSAVLGQGKLSFGPCVCRSHSTWTLDAWSLSQQRLLCRRLISPSFGKSDDVTVFCYLQPRSLRTGIVRGAARQPMATTPPATVCGQSALAAEWDAFLRERCASYRCFDLGHATSGRADLSQKAEEIIISLPRARARTHVYRPCLRT
jgi:hypothetical protein